MVDDRDVPGCCPPNRYDEVFDDRFARRIATRYERRGLGRAERRLVSLLEQHGLEGASVLEIGGGVGELQVELLKRGASRAVNLELASGYETEAQRLLERNGLGDRVERRLIDLAERPDAVAPADVVVLHRVVCCYPDHRRLLRAAADHCRGRLAFSHPPRNLVSRAVVAIQNTLFILTGRSFKAYVHPPDAMVAVVTARGLRPVLSQSGRVWQVQGLAR